jgi:hypothetical protein
MENVMVFFHYIKDLLIIQLFCQSESGLQKILRSGECDSHDFVANFHKA